MLLSIGSNWCEGASIRGAGLWDPAIRMPSEKEVWEEESEDEIGTRWGVLVAGSMGFGNYRHQVTLLILYFCNSLLHVPKFFILCQIRFACHENLCCSIELGQNFNLQATKDSFVSKLLELFGVPLVVNRD